MTAGFRFSLIMVLAALSACAASALAAPIAPIAITRLPTPQQPAYRPQTDLRDLTTLPRTYDRGYSTRPEDTMPLEDALTTSGRVSPSASNSSSVRRSGTKPAPAQQAGIQSPSPQSRGAPPAGNQISTTTVTRPGSRGFLDHFDLSYSAFINGPAVGASDWRTTYNPYSKSEWPIYVYHAIDLNFRIDRTHNIGMEVSGKNDLADGVLPAGYYTPIVPAFSIYDPQFWYKHNGLINTQWFSTDVQLSIFPSMTQYSREELMSWGAGAFDTTWNFKLASRNWTSYITTRLRPTLYLELQANDGYQREWLFMSAGAFLGYSFTSSWQVTGQAFLDSNIYADVNQRAIHGDANDDRFQLELNYFAGSFARVGVYGMTVITNPRLESTVIGLDLTFNLLTSRM